MKLKVKKEGRKNIYLATKKDIKSWLKHKKFKRIHNFKQSSFGLIGCDWDIKQVIELIDKTDKIGILIEDAAKHNMGHSLSVICDNELNIFDIGKIKKNDLKIK